MEVDNETNPFQIKSLLNGSINIVDLNKKRKLEAEQLGLPVSKHKCWKQSLSSKPPTFGSIPEVESFNPCTFKGKGIDVYDVSETGSAKDSNSFAEDSDSAMSVHAEDKFGTEDAKYLLYGEPEVTADVELAENLEESLVEYGTHIDYIYSGYGNYTVEQYQDKEIEEILNSNGANPNVYVLSSDDGVSTKRLHKLQKNQPLIKNLSSTFPCLCCRGEEYFDLNV